MWNSQTHDRAGQRDWYAWLIAPLSVAEFERNYYERRLIHIRRERETHYSALLSVTDLDTVLATQSASHPDIDLVQGDEPVPASQYTNNAGRILPLEVARQFDKGATIIFRQMQQRVPALARLCAELGRQLSSRVQTNVYLTPPEARGFAPHWDTHDVFVLQVSGTKRWSIYDTRIRLPLRGQRFEPGTRPGDLEQEFELRPGSAAYLPRGLTHSARSAGEPSLHITLGLTAFTWADFLVEGVTAAALQEEELRRNLPRDFVGGGLPRAERRRLFLEKLDIVSSRFDPEPVWRRFTDEIAATNQPLHRHLLAERLLRDGLTLRSRVRRRAGVHTEVSDRGDACVLRSCGQELRLPIAAWPALRFAVTRDEFSVREIPDCLDADGKLVLAARLIREGILERA